MSKNFTIILSYPADLAHLTKWHPTERTGTFSTLTRGCFSDQDAAHAWATKECIDRSTYEVVELPPIDEDPDPAVCPEIDLLLAVTLEGKLNLWRCFENEPIVTRALDLGLITGDADDLALSQRAVELLAQHGVDAQSGMSI